MKKRIYYEQNLMKSYLAQSHVIKNIQIKMIKIIYKLSIYECSCDGNMNFRKIF